MKPLPVAALTDEDFWIWANHVTCRNVSPLGLFGRSQDADRRDAELMLRAQMHTNRGWSYIRLDNWNAATWDVEAAVVALPGWYLVRKGNITYFA
jgi:hypothetical protein